MSDKEVLHAGGGVGVGTRILAEAGAKRVTGIDASEDVISEAVRHAGDVAQLVAGDLEALPFAPASFDVAVCFDLVEPTEQRAQLVLDELHRVLREDGILLVSLSAGLGPELASRFPAVVLHRQQSRLASAIVSESAPPEGDGAPSARLAAPPDASRLPATLAVAGKREAPDPGNLVMLAGAFELERWEGELTRAQREADTAWRAVEEARAREAHAASERQLVARRLIEAEQLTAQAQVRARPLEEEIGRRREEIVNRDAAVAALKHTASQGIGSLRRGARALLGARR